VSSEVDPATGEFHATIPFALPRARGAAQPALALSYSSADDSDGDGGVGWNLALPFIERRGPSGLRVPLYKDWSYVDTKPDWDHLDTYVYNGAPLIPVSDAPPDSMSRWTSFRAQVESGAATHFYLSPDHRTWDVYTPSGMIFEYGAALDGAYANATDPVPAQVYRWRLVRQYDMNSNTVVYLWQKGQLSDIYDTPVASAGSGLPASLADWAHHVHLGYTNYHDTPANQVDWMWAPPGVLGQVDVASQPFSGGPRELLRRYHFRYSARTSYPNEYHPFLEGVQEEGRCATPIQESPSGATFALPVATTCDRLPETTLLYTRQKDINLQVVTASAPGNQWVDQGIIFADINGDGFPDGLHMLPQDPWPLAWSSVPPFWMWLNHHGKFGSTLNAQQYVGAGRTIVGDFVQDGVADFLTLGGSGSYAPKLPWLYDNATDQPLLNVTLNEYQYQSDTSVSLMSPPPSAGNTSADGVTNWNLLLPAPAPAGVQVIFNGTPVDLNGDGLVDWYGDQEFWKESRNDNGVQNNSYGMQTLARGVAFATRGRGGRITPLGLGSVEVGDPGLPNGNGTSTTPPQPLQYATAWGMPWAVQANYPPDFIAQVNYHDAIQDRLNAAQIGQSSLSGGFPLGRVIPQTLFMTFADMDRDGLVDLVTFEHSTFPGGGGGLYWYRNRGDGTFGDGPLCNPGAVPGSRYCAYPAPVPVQGAPGYFAAQSGGVWVDLQEDCNDFPCYLHDVNADGRPDLISLVPDSSRGGWPYTAGVQVRLNSSGIGTPLTFEAGTFTIPPANLPGWNVLGSPLAFADMNANGSDDIIVLGNVSRQRYLDPAENDPDTYPSTVDHGIAWVDLMAAPGATKPVRPGLLTTINNGIGGQTTIAYETIQTLHERDVAANYLGATKYPFPQVRPVATQLVTQDGVTKVTKTISYDYHWPVYDPGERSLRGFKDVVQTIAGDPTARTPIPGQRIHTTYLIGNCPYSPGSACTAGVDNPYRALGPVPLLIETSDDTASTYLSTVHTQYRVDRVETGLDARMVRRAYAEQVDTFLYDTSISSSGFAEATVVDVNDQDSGVFGSGAYGLPLHQKAPSFAQLRTFRQLDANGNPSVTVDYGNIAGTTPDAPIFTQATWWQSGTTFLLKTTETGTGTIAAPPAPASASTSYYSYDGFGNLTDTYADLYGTAALDRHHEDSTAQFAPNPQTQSSQAAGTHVHLAHFKVDVFGNVTDAQAPQGQCVHYDYDQTFSELPVGTTTSTGPVAPGAAVGTCGPTSLKASAVYDRGLGAVTTAYGVDGVRTDTVYDTFGRLSQVFLPDPQSPGTTDVYPAVTVAYDHPDTGGWRTQTTTLNNVNVLRATPPRIVFPVSTDAWDYTDGFGGSLVHFQQADTQNGDTHPWIATGLVERAKTGQITVRYPPQWIYDQGSPLDPSQYSGDGTEGGNGSTALGEASEQLTLDAFGRVVVDEAYGALSTAKYHALSIDTYDAMQLGSNTPTTVTKDGHGRIIGVTARLRANGGTVDAITAAATFSATGQPTRVTRSHSAGSDTYSRSLTYDSLGRLVENTEPNTSTAAHDWRYAYDDAGQLVGTSDARGCGENLTYDAAGRLLMEDYSPCLDSQPDYTPGNPTTGANAEAFYVYDGVESGQAASPFIAGHLNAIADRGAHTRVTYDGRGRVTNVARQIAAPWTTPTTPNGYAPWWYAKSFQYDELGRPVRESTGADLPELRPNASLGSYIARVYSLRGAVSSVSSAYGTLLQSATFDAQGRPLSASLPDAAGTTATWKWNPVNQFLDSYAVTRKAPQLWTTGQKWSDGTGSYGAPGSGTYTLQTVLAQESFLYDLVGNPTDITDQRLAGEWLDGTKPISRHITYDDLYRVTGVTYSGTDTKYLPPTSGVSNAAPPYGVLQARVGWQSYGYDWLGNTSSSDDNEHAFFDRSLGTVTNSPGVNRLVSATNGKANVATTYDDAGNLTVVMARQNGALPTSSHYSYTYDWDEVGRLVRARRSIGRPGVLPGADVSYIYDSGGNRVVVASTDVSGNSTYALRVFDTLRLDGAHWNAASNPGDYERTASTESVQIPLGAATARIVYAETSLPSLSSGHVHVFLEMGDTLGSTSAVIDRDTGELVERSTFEAYGSDETDYRPARWGSFRETFRFTGQESDDSVGLTYFGQRYYSSHLGRWLSPDPLTIHGLGADLNPYAYVSGRVASDVDAFGLYDPNTTDSLGRYGDVVTSGNTTIYPTEGFTQFEFVDPGQSPPQSPDASNLAIRDAVDSHGKIEGRDVVAAAKGFVNGVSETLHGPNAPAGHGDDLSAGTEEAARQFGRNLAVEATGAGISKVLGKIAGAAPAFLARLPVGRFGSRAVDVANVVPTVGELRTLGTVRGFQVHHLLPEYLGKMLGYTSEQMLEHPGAFISQWAHTGAANPEAVHKAISTYLPPMVNGSKAIYTAAEIRAGLQAAYESLGKSSWFDVVAHLIR
jgi:RHS repeat-associated protein